MTTLFKTNRWWRIKLFATAMFSAMLLFTACVEEQTTPPDNEKTISFSLNVPPNFTPQTYAIPDGVDTNNKYGDAKISSVDVLLFDKSGNYFSGPHYGAIGTTTGTDNSVDVTIRIPENTEDNFVMGVFANSRSFFNSVTFNTADNKATTLNKITVEKNKWDADASDANASYIHIPMYGEGTLSSYTGTGGEKVKLHRMLARINVTNTPQALTKFSFKHVYLANYNTVGRVAYTSLSGEIPVLNVPSDPKRGADAIQYPVSGNSCINEIFTFEAAAGTPATIGTNPCIIIGGEYDGVGNYYYYRVDFADADGDYLDIARNHSYNVLISKIDGPGYSDIEDAIKSKPVNIKYDVEKWADGDIVDAAYNGQYMIGTSAAAFNFDSSARDQSSGDNILVIQTNHPDGWAATIEGDNADWLSLIDFSGASVSSGSVGNTTVKLNLSDNNGTSSVPRSAKIRLTAGNVIYIVSVTQSNEIKNYSLFQPEADSYTMFSAPSGDRIFIPVSRANGNAQDIVLSSSDVFTVEQTAGGNALGKVEAFGVGSGGYIYVEAGTGTGEAKVAIRKEGEQAPAPPLYEWTINVKAPTVETSEANCYIVAPNSGILFPVSQANNTDGTILGDQLGSDDAFTAELVWTDNLKAISPHSNIRSIAPVGKGATGQVFVATGSGEGNAVVAIKKGEDILWSWHIWVTTYVPSDAGNGLMDRNLGALDNGLDISGNIALTDNTVGLMYQWGRKDPFPGTDEFTSGNLTSSGKERTIYYGTAATPRGTLTTLPGTIAQIAVSSTTDARPISESVQNPDVFIKRSSSADWSSQLTGSGSARWNGTGNSKTVYDPCPPGWRVPINGTWTGSAGNDGWQVAEFVTTHRIQRNDTQGGVYPAPGYRNLSDGSLGGVPSTGRYWSASPYGSDDGFYLIFSSGIVNPSVNLFRSLGYSVRCVQDAPIVVFGLADSYVLNGDTYTFSLYTDDAFTITPTSTTEIASITSSGNAGVKTISFTTNEVVSADGNRDISFTVTSGGNSKDIVIVGKPLLPIPFSLFRAADAYPVKSNGISHRFYVNSPVAWEISEVVASTGITIASSLTPIQGSANVETAVEFTTDGSVTAGTVKVTFSDPSGTYGKTQPQTLNFGAEYKPALHRGWAGSNIYYDSNTSNLTFKDTGTSQSEQLLQGVHFKWGSLFGISPSTNVVWSATPWVYPPTGGAKTLSDAGISTTWNSSYTSQFPHIATSISNNDDFNSLYYLTNGSTCVGDICYWLTENNYAPSGAKWRMPTANELLTAFGGLSRSATTGGSSAAHGIGTMNSHIVNIDGVFLPAAGYRNNTNGNLDGVGTIGNYWSSSPDDTNVRYMGFDAIASMLDISCSYGLSVRCVKE